MKQQHSFTTTAPNGTNISNHSSENNNNNTNTNNLKINFQSTPTKTQSLVLADSDSTVNIRESIAMRDAQQPQQINSPIVISKNQFAQIIHKNQQPFNSLNLQANGSLIIVDENINTSSVIPSSRSKDQSANKQQQQQQQQPPHQQQQQQQQQQQRISQRNNRNRSSRNSIKQNLIIMSNNNNNTNNINMSGTRQNEIAFSPVGGPEIAAQFTMRERKNMPSPQNAQLQLSMTKNTIETFKIVPNNNNSQKNSSNQQPFMTNRQNQQNTNNNSINLNQSQIINNNATGNNNNNGSMRNLQNLRSKRYNRVVAGGPQQNNNNHENVNQSLINPQLQSIQIDQTIRVPPIQNGFYFNPNTTTTINNQQSPTVGNQSVRYHQNNNGGQNSTKNSQHNRVQSLDISAIYNKNQNINNNSIQPLGGGNQMIMPSITTAVNSPKNGHIIGGNHSLNNSIEKINKGINDSIKGSNKEIQLIQAYQQQKWKDQINQRKIRAVQNARSIDVTNDPTNHNSSYIIQKDQFMSAKNSVFNQQINLNRGDRNSQQIGQGVGQKQPRVIGGGSLSSRLQQETIMHESTEADSQVSKLSIKFPLTAEQAYKTLLPYLWEYEKQEILEYEMIYFFNINERRKGLSSMLQSSLGNSQSQSNGNSNLMQMGSGSSKMNNYGFDNENQEYNVIMHEHLGYRYEVIKKLGKGSFGIVLKCFDHKQKEFVALKILKNKKRLYKQGLVEAKLIETLNKSDLEDKKNIIRKLDQFVFRKHLIITFEMLSINLYEFIKMNNFQGFSLNLIKRFAIQILISLFFMKEHNMVHCDMKPENILLRKLNKSGIKIIDFGSGCFENEKIYTYIQSRFYRAPEIVLGIPYTAAIDMWSYGCILYELFIGYPLFPGEDEKEHMAMMMEVKGIPPRSVLARSSRRKVFFDDDYQPILAANSRGKVRQPNAKPLLTIMSNCPDKDFIDFIDRCLEWKVESRMTPEQAFSHPFISKAVNELKGMRSTGGGGNGTGNGQSEENTMKQSTIQIQQQQTQKFINISNQVSNNNNNGMSMSESILPQINNKQQ